MIENITRIKTVTGNVYELPGKGIPQLWEIQLFIYHINENGSVDRNSTRSSGIHVEREVLENHGLLPRADTKEVESPVTKTPEDLILELLERVGVYPTEG